MTSSTKVLNISNVDAVGTASADVVRTFGGVLCGGRSTLFHYLADGEFAPQSYSAWNILHLYMYLRGAVNKKLQ